MLTELSITNLAIIEKLHVSFHAGLTALTGETGAGKSIIIDAVSLIMGERASLDLIRSGCDEAAVEALFDITQLPQIKLELQQRGFDADQELIIKRTLSRSGKNRIFVNGGMATVSVASSLARSLINIYGQHESQTLLRPENQLQLLDSYAGLSKQRENFAKLFTQLSSVVETLATLDQQEREAARRLDVSLFQQEEIALAELYDGEDEQLEEERQIIASAEKRLTVTNQAYDVLYNGDGALLGQLQHISTALKDIAHIDQTLTPLASSLDEAYLLLEDSALSLRNYVSRIESDPQALQRIEDRLDLISRLKRKYGATIGEILQFKQQLDQEIASLQGRVEDRQQLEANRQQLEEQIREQGTALTAQRRSAALKLQQELTSEVGQLAMKDAVIEVAFETFPEPRSSGYERVELLFSPNPGEQARPLAKIASGGELSRLMLAFKQVLPESDVPTLIFDEVDTGISGATSELVGKKLKNVATRQQVFCITHLPQVASCADHHLLVKKSSDQQRTTTAVVELSQTERIGEIARMLAGEKITPSALNHAEVMLAEFAGC